MSKRQQLPPQIRKVTVTDRRTGKPVVRYQLTVDAGHDPETGARRQIRRRFATEKAARDELATVLGGVTCGRWRSMGYGVASSRVCAGSTST